MYPPEVPSLAEALILVGLLLSFAAVAFGYTRKSKKCNRLGFAKHAVFAIVILLAIIPVELFKLAFFNSHYDSIIFFLVAILVPLASFLFVSRPNHSIERDG